MSTITNQHIARLFLTMRQLDIFSDCDFYQICTNGIYPTGADKLVMRIDIPSSPSYRWLYSPSLI